MKAVLVTFALATALPLAGCPDGTTDPTCDPACASGSECVDGACVDVDECATGADGCDPNATCSNTDPGFSCACDTGFTGDGTTCTAIPAACSPDPCLNGGACADDGSGGFTCTCADGYDGDTCADDIDDCDPNPCRNDGSCTDGVDSFTCSCPTGWEGDTCADNVDDCPDPNPCEHGGTCVDALNAYSCDCADGFGGTTCARIECAAGNPCQNGGTCRDTGDDANTCDCTAGYEGDLCETDTNECDPNPCDNGATCAQGDPGDFACTCVGDWEGDLCDDPITACDAAPCQNDGACVDLDGGASYFCNCADGWGGTVCDVAATSCTEDANCDDSDDCTVDSCLTKVCAEGTLQGDRCFSATHWETSANWSAARAQCELRSGQLATIRSQADNDLLNQLRREDCDFAAAWIGLADYTTEGDYLWESGEALTFTNWGSGEPDTGGNDFVYLSGTAGSWYDTGQGAKQACYLCEFAAQDNPAPTCANTYQACDDEDACTTDSCDAGSCVNAVITCDDGDPCTDDSCDPDLGCVFAPKDCGDGDPCTVDSCVGDGVCENDTVQVVTEAGVYQVCAEASNWDDAVAACATYGMALPTPGDAADNDALTEVALDAGLAAWWLDVSDADIEGAYVDTDGAPVTFFDWCDDGEPSDDNGTVSCSDLGHGPVLPRAPFGGPSTCRNDCVYAGACASDGWADERCSSDRAFICATLCDDGDACTEDVLVSAEAGCTSTAIDCDDGNPCTTDSCDPDLGCLNVEDTCDDGDPCTDDSCNPADGACVNDVLGCDDQNDCTTDACETQPECPDGATLIDGACYEALPAVSFWGDARTTCKLRGGDLAVVTSGDENAAVRGLIDASCGPLSAWIGAEDLDGDLRPLWVDGTDLTGYANLDDNATIDDSGVFDDNKSFFDDNSSVVAIDENATWVRTFPGLSQPCAVCEYAPVQAGACAYTTVDSDTCNTAAGDNCLTDPCQNGGTCVNGFQTFTCECAAGFTGDTCEVDVDDCAPNPCENGGACTDGVDSFTCACTEFFAGEVCQDLADLCDGGTCSDRGDCYNTETGPTCDCYGPYAGDDCSNDVYGNCDENLCDNGGTCLADFPDSFECVCPETHFGDLCETLVTPCAPDPCQNEGVCTIDGDGFTCACATGWQGDTCETPNCATLDCDDGDPCTADECDDATGCSNPYDGSVSCSDDLVCTDDLCFSGDYCLEGELATSYGGTSSCMVATAENLTWADAKLACETADGHLATIHDFAENAAVDAARAASCGTNARAWIGFTDENVEGVYEWVTGEPFGDYVNWSGGQPDDSNFSEDYGMLFSNGRWNDAGSGSTPCYVCELPALTTDTFACNNTDVVCDPDDSACTTDACVEADGGCTHTAVTCADPADDLCMQGACDDDLGCVDIDLPCGGACEIGSCNSSSGSCLVLIDDCDDGDDCTIDSCGVASCPAGTTEFGDSCYAFEQTPKKKPLDAALACVEQGGKLVAIGSADENQFVWDAALAESCDNPWIGMSDAQTEGSWYWTTREEVVYTNWSGGEPNDAGNGEDWAVMYLATGRWNDASSNNKQCYVCEIPTATYTSCNNEPTGGTEGALDVCNNFDDDCDGEIDEDSAKTCVIVDTTDDTNDANVGDGVCADADGNCSLRAAFEEGFSSAVIHVPAGTYTQTSGAPPWTITTGIDLDGAGPEAVTLDAGGNTVGLLVTDASNVSIYGVTITGASQHGVDIVDTRVVIENSVVTGNGGELSDDEGAGIRYDAAGGEKALELIDTTVSMNVTTGKGGGLYATSGDGGYPLMIVTDSTFSGNDADQGGGIYLDGGTTFTDLNLSGSTFDGNSCLEGGSAIFYMGTGSNAGIVLEESTFKNNSTGGGNSGGAIALWGGDGGVGTFDDLVFADNACNRGSSIDISAGWDVLLRRSSFYSDTGWQGALHIGGNAGTIEVENSTFARNANGNAAIYLSGASDVLFRHVTVTDNNNSGIWMQGAASVSITNSIIADNGLTADDLDVRFNGDGGVATSLGGNVFGTEIAGLTLATNDQAPTAGGTLDALLGSLSTDDATGKIYYAPLCGSPALNNALDGAIDVDQLGEPRSQAYETGGQVAPDSGAIELSDDSCDP